MNPGDTPYVVTGITEDSTKADGTSANANERPRGRLDHKDLGFSRKELAQPPVGTLPWQAPGISGRGDPSFQKLRIMSTENTIEELKARTPGGFGVTIETPDPHRAGHPRPFRAAGP